MSAPIALTREIGDALERCVLTHLERAPIDLELARAQHAGYRAALSSLGCELVCLAAEPGLADAVFVEDTAVVLDEIAVLARPGAASRRPEVESVAAALESLRPVRRIEAPGTLDGGDVLRLGHTLFVGETVRTNREGARQLAAIIAPYGYRVQPVPITRCLHLKSAVTAIGEDAVLVNSRWIDIRIFARFECVEVDPGEPFAANALVVAGSLIYPEENPRTLERLAARGTNLVPVAASEVAKAEGAVTCCSILIERTGGDSGTVRA